MPADRIDDPFEDSRVPEVRLKDGPLEVALFQVRFPGPVTRIEQAIDSNEIAQALSSEYPFADRQEVLSFVIQPGHQPSPQKAANTTALSLSDASQKWTLNIARDSVSLTTTAYVNRDDLLERAGRIFEALSKVAEPPAVARVGLRYLNRVRDVGLIRKFCGNGGLAEPIRHQQEFSLARDEIQSALTELQFAWTSEQRLQARWGVLPAGQTVANPFEPLPDPSWLLDVDAFHESLFEFSSEEVVKRLKVLSERAYRYFRWVFTPVALPDFGAVDD
ncbi:TIGR04255 family protein [Mycobacterium sp. E3198]|uniref:TIGR04255 family protein n=1 Tax=Mycobacterium sp. E3198 TaxID=1834143 RepID=UPI0009ECF9D3|nr:TIGR04255 family protein [Mycobacterium sp. E3198]